MTDDNHPPDMKIEFTDKGELSLTLDGKLISQPTKTLDPTVRFRDPAAVVPYPWGASEKTWPVVPDDCRPQSTSFDAAKRQLTQTFAWGEVVRTYRAVPGGADIEVTVRNQSPKTLCAFSQRLFTLKLPYETGPARTTEAMYFGQSILAQGRDTTVWFIWGGIRDLRRLFKSLKTVNRSDLDDGMVVAHHNLDEQDYR
jgi:hypothetical protein